MLSERRFRDEIKLFVEKMNEQKVNWTICEGGKYARESHLETLPDRRIVTAEAHILYNPTYKVPVLWFNYFENNGSPLPFSSVVRDVLKIPEQESEASIRTRISHFEHPYLGVLYFNIHPCNTSSIMKELNTDESFLPPWFSVYGQQIHLPIPQFPPSESLLEMYKH
ncbi:unnamed protein product [Caenorhabditis sp. 36 PRJEB53466]|nr:unnamed protein product [Caenorhabditis sp. 36 PRJEB53466]